MSASGKKQRLNRMRRKMRERQRDNRILVFFAGEEVPDDIEGEPIIVDLLTPRPKKEELKHPDSEGRCS